MLNLKVGSSFPSKAPPSVSHRKIAQKEENEKSPGY